VGHIIADGGFDTPARRDAQPDGDAENWLDTEGMAQSYWALHVQPKRAWSWEIDLRPYTVYSRVFKLIVGKMVNTERSYYTQFKSLT
jgi:hypothetical protein